MLLIIVIMICTGVLAWMVFSTKLRPMSNARKINMMSAYKSYKSFENHQKRTRAKEKFESNVEKISNIFLTDYKKNRLEYIVRRLGQEDAITPERIFARQLMYTTGFILVGLFCMPFDRIAGITVAPLNKIIGVGIMLMGIYAWKEPYREYLRIIKRKDENIMTDLFAFFSVLCSTYQRSYSTALEEVVNTFIKGANKDMKEELNILIDNIRRFGVTKALFELKARVPLPYMLRVCDTLITKFTTMGDNTATMLHLKEELKKNRYMKLEKQLQKKLRNVLIAQLSIYVLLAMYSIMHLYFQSFDSIKVLF